MNEGKRNPKVREGDDCVWSIPFASTFVVLLCSLFLPFLREASSPLYDDELVAHALKEYRPYQVIRMFSAALKRILKIGAKNVAM